MMLQRALGKIPPEVPRESAASKIAHSLGIGRALGLSRARRGLVATAGAPAAPPRAPGARGPGAQPFRPSGQTGSGANPRGLYWLGSSLSSPLARALCDPIFDLGPHQARVPWYRIFARGFLQGGTRLRALGLLRQRGSSLESRRFSLRGPGKSGYTLSPLTFNVWRRLRQLEILGSEGG